MVTQKNVSIQPLIQFITYYIWFDLAYSYNRFRVYWIDGSKSICLTNIVYQCNFNAATQYIYLNPELWAIFIVHPVNTEDQCTDSIYFSFLSQVQMPPKGSNKLSHCARKRSSMSVSSACVFLFSFVSFCVKSCK